MPDETAPTPSPTPPETTPTQPVEVPAALIAASEPPTSPTGEAIIPPIVAKIAAPICLIAGMIVMEGPEFGLVVPALVLPWLKLLWVLGTTLGIVSPGARRK